MVAPEGIPQGPPSAIKLLQARIKRSAKAAQGRGRRQYEAVDSYSAF
jgi:hypothetical protein